MLRSNTAARIYGLYHRHPSHGFLTYLMKNEKDTTSLAEVAQPSPSQSQADGRLATTLLQRSRYLLFSRHAVLLVKNRSFYDSLKHHTLKGKRVSLTQAAFNYLFFWRSLTKSPADRRITSPDPILVLHSGASNSILLGDTLGLDLQTASQVNWEARGLWDSLLRIKKINYLELREVTDKLRDFTKMLPPGTYIKYGKKTINPWFI